MKKEIWWRRRIDEKQNKYLYLALCVAYGIQAGVDSVEDQWRYLRKYYFLVLLYDVLDRRKITKKQYWLLKVILFQDPIYFPVEKIGIMMKEVRDALDGYERGEIPEAYNFEEEKNEKTKM